MPANMRRPAAKKADALLSKGISTGDSKKIKKGVAKLSAVGGPPNEVASSNQMKKMAKRMNQSITASGTRPIRDGGFKERNADRRASSKSIGKKTR
jgi:hypothetical protein